MSFFRGRRLRQTETLRDILAENRVMKEDLIMPYFIMDTNEKHFRKEISSMPCQYQLSEYELIKQVEKSVNKGLKSLILFGIPTKKDPEGTGAYDANGIIQKAVRALKSNFPNLIVITDVCLCEYTSHGHCGLVQNEKVLNDPTLKLLAQVALSHVEAGADIVAPSDMMDGRVQAIRTALDTYNFTETPIMSYSVKYASSFYGPFREAAEGAPQFGDRRTYQMDFRNTHECFLESGADVAEGADILIVKPGIAYLDILRNLRNTCALPLAAYQVSGEYSMIKAAAMQGWLDEEAVVFETLTASKRAGANLILSYFTEDVLDYLDK